MDKLSIFSKKLGKAIEVVFAPNGILVTPDGETEKETDVILAWNNYGSSWIDNGWVNESSHWVDNGWNNYGNDWLDNGWNNYGDHWMDGGWNNYGDSWSNNASGGGGGCYITTACVEHMGLDDNCHELSVLREYRDRLVAEDEVFRSEALEYYRKAPLIVQCIQNDEDRDSILEDLYQNMILPCVSLLEEGKIEEANTVYLNGYRYLADRYLT